MRSGVLGARGALSTLGAVVLAITLGFGAGAARADGGLSVDEALRRAEANSAAIAAQVSAASAAGAARLPPTDGLELRAQQGDLGVADRSDARLALRLRWRGLAVAAAERAVDAAGAEALRAEATAMTAALRWEVERAFAQVLLLEAELERRELAAAAWAEVAAGMERRAALGQEAAVDVAEARVRAAEAALRASRVRAAAEGERAWLGVAVGAPVSAGGLAGPVPIPRPPPQDLPRADPGAAAAEARLARAEALPRLDFVQGGVQSERVSGVTGGEISLAVRLPVLDGSRAEAQRARGLAAAEERRAEAERATATGVAGAAAEGIAAGLRALAREREVVAGLAGTLPAATPGEPLATRGLRAQISELEADLYAAERRLWP
ncbi:MAG: hypothetical protein JNM72_18295 [Deltaproteobacteria bacterium]|nr:hypothetical protein [Deltaproteobacteria bacterium]